MTAILFFGILLIVMTVSTQKTQVTYEQELIISRGFWPTLTAEQLPGLYAKKIPLHTLKNTRKLMPFVQVATDRGEVLPWSEVQRRIELIEAWHNKNFTTPPKRYNDVFKIDDDIDVSAIPF